MAKNSQSFPLDDNLEVSPEVIQRELAFSYEVVKKLLPFLAKRGIPVTPSNFRLFYDYIIFANPEVNKILNELLEKDVKFHSQLSNNLYILFYSHEFAEHQVEAIARVANDFIDASVNVAESLQTAQAQNDRFYKTLSDTSRHMADIADAGALQPYLKELLEETEETLASGVGISAKLKEANEIIATLKKELKSQTDLAKIDELTKLSNRRHLNMEAAKIIREAVTRGQPLSAIAFDIDFFKRINDTWGHNYGDKVLTICAEIIKNAARRSDLAVRMGGEEFLLMCSNLDLETALKVAERVRQSIATTEITIRGAPLSVTVSGGVAGYLPGEDLSAFIGRADRALYRAKESGRNRICAASDTDEPLISDRDKAEEIVKAEENQNPAPA